MPDREPGDVPRWRRHLRIWGSDPAAEVDEELAFHIEERARHNVAHGVEPDQARAEAERRFGDIGRIRSECMVEQQRVARRAQLGDRVGDVANDVRLAIRSLARAPVFTLTAGIALALGIGATTAVFSVVGAVLLSPLPYADADDVVAVYTAWDGTEQASLSPAEYLDYAEQVRAFSALGVYATTAVNLVEGDIAERVIASVATASTFDALGIDAAAGRLFSEAEGATGGPDVVVLSHEFWQARFGGTREVVGRTLMINGQSREVVGVLPAGVRLPANYADLHPPTVFIPLRIDRASDPPRTSHYLSGVARLASGFTVEMADAELKRVARALPPMYPDAYSADMRFDSFIRPVHADVVGDTRVLLMLLGAAVGLVLLIACANVSGLVLTRTEDRRRELAVRRALGAGRGRIARQLLIETLVLTLVAGAAGVLLAVGGVRALMLLQPGEIPRMGEARVDSLALVFTFVVCLVTTLLVALAPLRFGVAATGALREGARGTATRASQRMRHVLIAGEVAVCIVLLAGAGLLLRSFGNLMGVEPGYRIEQVLTVPISLPAAGYPDDAARRRFFTELEQNAAALPGVVAAGAVINLPLAASVGDMGIELPGRPVAEGESSARLDWQIVTPGWFDAMGIDLVRGRGITAADRDGAPGAVVLSESAARKYWDDDVAIGQRFTLGGGAGPGEVTVVGIVRDVRQGALTEEPPAVMYLPHAQFTFWNGGAASSAMTLVLHTAGDPLAALPPLRDQVRRMDPQVPLGSVSTMQQVVSRAVAEPRFATSVLGSFAAIALMLAMIGVYGLVAYTVARRTREIAVRMALGAEPGAVVRQMLAQGMRPVLIGIALGTVGALAATHVLSSMLFGVSPRDPVTLAGTVLLLALTAGLACLMPSRRAATVAPMGALREE